MDIWDSLAQSVLLLCVVASGLLWMRILSGPGRAVGWLDEQASSEHVPVLELLIVTCLLWPTVPRLVASMVPIAAGQATGPLRLTIGNLALWGVLIMFDRGMADPSLDSAQRLRLLPCRRDLRIGVFGFLASVGPVIAVMMLTRTLRTEESQHPYLRLVSDSPAAEVIGAVALAAIVAAPLTEELVFRVILQRSLERFHPLVALLSISLLFAAIHADSLARLPDVAGLFLLGLILGFVYQRTRSYPAVVITHLLFNALNLGLICLNLMSQ